VKLRPLFRISGFTILLALAGASAATKRISPELASIDRKIAHLEANGSGAHPSTSPTVLTEAVSGTARIDFDQLRAGTNSSNPLLSIFSGVHEVEVETHAYGKGGQGCVHVDSVSLDGIEVPHFVLQLFVEKYIQPKYPDLGIDSRFTLPDRIDTAVIGQHQVTVTQK
jgi:hypothetical protein